MKYKILGYSVMVLFTATAIQACAQTKCVWIEKWENGSMTQKSGISIHLVRLLAGAKGNFTIDDTPLSFDSLLSICEQRAMFRMKDSTGSEETRIHGGILNITMNQSSEGHNHLFVESSDSGESPKVSKFRVESAEAVAVLLAMIGSKNLDEDIDKIESALERGGVIYIQDLKKQSTVWIYVN